MHQIGFIIHCELVIDIIFVEELPRLNEFEKHTNDLQNQNSIYCTNTA